MDYFIPLLRHEWRVLRFLRGRNNHRQADTFDASPEGGRASETYQKNGKLYVNKGGICGFHALGD